MYSLVRCTFRHCKRAAANIADTIFFCFGWAALWLTRSTHFFLCSDKSVEKENIAENDDLNQSYHGYIPESRRGWAVGSANSGTLDRIAQTFVNFAAVVLGACFNSFVTATTFLHDWCASVGHASALVNWTAIACIGYFGNFTARASWNAAIFASRSVADTFVNSTASARFNCRQHISRGAQWHVRCRTGVWFTDTSCGWTTSVGVHNLEFLSFLASLDII